MSGIATDTAAARPPPPQAAGRTALVEQLHTLGVAPGGVLLVHASYRAVRPVQGGPQALIDALRAALGPDGTLVMPSWTGDDDAPFDPHGTPAAPDLGALAELYRRQPGVRRSRHPYAFAAAGPAAAHIVDGPLPRPPHGLHSPVGRVHRHDGQVLLIGVGHDANTTLHLAEALAGVPYARRGHCTLLQDGRPLRVAVAEPDHCCERFALADDWLRARGLQAEGPVGHAHARLVRAQHLVHVALERLARDRLLFLHPPDAGCRECDEARAGIDG